jgi:hypothetical protein
MQIYEIGLVGVLMLLIGGAFVAAYRSRDQTMFWSPLTLFAAVFAYYFVVGPLLALGFGSTSAYGVDFRPMMWKAWLAGLLGLASIYAGFAIRTKRFKDRLVAGIPPELRRRFWRYFFALAGLGAVGFVYLAYVSGQSLATLLLPIHGGLGLDLSSSEREGLAAGNYLLLLINVFIPAMCLLSALQLDQPLPRRLLLVILPAVQVAFFYASLGFRHRIVILALSMAATTYLMRRKRPNPGTLVLSAAGIVLGAGLIVMTRSYGRGLDLSQIAGLGLVDVFLGGFNDAGTFFTTALVIDSIPSTFPYVGLNPLWIALTIPVPRTLWPNKPFPLFLEYFGSLTGTQGQAVPVVGEHYMMAGWVGIVVGGLIIGIIYRCFWEFYRANPGNPLVVTLYAVSWALCFPVVNRGYLAQTLMEFFFDLLPLVVLYRLSRKTMVAIGARSPARSPGRPVVPAAPATLEG